MARALLVLCAALVGVTAQKPDMEQDVPDFVMACVDSSRWVYGDSNACEDDSGWIKHDGNGNKDCAWIAAEVAAGDTGRQCERAKNKKKVKAEDACACACPQATNPPNDCAWVGEDTDARCGLSLDLTGAEACPDTCTPCVDDATWHVAGEESRDCEWVSGNSDGRCDRVGEDDRLASEACVSSCDACPSGNDSGSWFYKKTGKDCAWVAKKSKRCKKTGADRAEYACPSTCSASCNEESDEFSELGSDDEFACETARMDPVSCASAFPQPGSLQKAIEEYLDPIFQCDVLTNLGPVAGWDVSCVKDFSEIFEGTGVQRPAFDGDVSAWDTSSATDLNNAFRVSTFNGDISNWNTTSVTTMRYAFYGNTVFNQNLIWNVAKVKWMNYAFNGATAFNGGNGATAFIGAWATSSLKYSYNMFQGATSFNRDLSGWNVDKVVDCGNMFKNATTFDQNLGWTLDSGANMNNVADGAGCTVDNCGISLAT